jgi:hypothetical protein
VATGVAEFIDKAIADPVFSPDIWSKNVLVKQEANLVFAKLVNREYERDAKVGKQVLISTISDLSVRDKTINTAITYETVAETQIPIPLNIWDYAAIGIEDIVEVQSHINLRSEYEKKIAYALAKSVDTKLSMGVAGFSKSVGTLGTPLSDDDIRDAVEILDNNNVPEDGRVFVMSPAEKNDKLGLEKWVSVLYRGNDNRNGGGKQVNTGQIGNEIYGLTPYVSTNVAQVGVPAGPATLQAYNAIFHKDAYALVMQRAPKMHLFYDIDFFTWKVASEEILGHAELRDDHGVWAKGVGKA